jgi:hypothetical protein
MKYKKSLNDDMIIKVDGDTETHIPKGHALYNEYEKWAAIEGNVAEELPQESLSSLKTRLAAQLDDIVAKVYEKTSRFMSEYQLREQSAIKYREASYVGEPDNIVKGFADKAKLTYTEATDLILTQADNLRVNLVALSDLRMNKYVIASKTTIASANKVYDETVDSINLIKEKL